MSALYWDTEPWSPDPWTVPPAAAEPTAAAEPVAAPVPMMSRAQRQALEERYAHLLERDGAALQRVAASYEADPARREDLFQEICLAVWQALPRFRGESSERTFVFRVAHNRGITHSTRQKAHGRDSELEEAREIADPRPDPARDAEAGERRRRLERAVRTLPVGLRQVLTLSLEGLPQRQIGEILGITENNVAVRLNRARKALRNALENER